jgi:hypothetical protein
MYTQFICLVSTPTMNTDSNTPSSSKLGCLYITPPDRYHRPTSVPHTHYIISRLDIKIPSTFQPGNLYLIRPWIKMRHIYQTAVKDCNHWLFYGMLTALVHSFYYYLKRQTPNKVQAIPGLFRLHGFLRLFPGRATFLLPVGVYFYYS